MLINNLGSVAASQRTDIKKTEAKLQAAIASLVSGRKSQDVAEVAIATQLQSQVAGLKQISSNIAQAVSLTQVADGAVARSQEITSRLQEIAQTAANGTANEDQRKQLNEEFQALTKELDAQVARTQFNGQQLLDGSLSGNNKLSLGRILAANDSNDSGDGDSGLDINNLSTQVLFGGQSLNVLTADNAQAALSTLGNAQTNISEARASVGSFQQTLNYAAATIDSAAINQQAAQSLLSDADFLHVVTESQNAQIQRNAQLSLAAQGNRLPAALLQLVS
jgi:flagellin